MSKILKTVIVLAGWFALAAQYYLIIKNRVVPVTETTIRYFSFFTILTNILVAITFTREISKQTKTSFITAVTIYIVVVGTVYQILLRHIWQPTGLQKWVDELLHTLIPLLVLVYWVFYKKRAAIKFSKIPGWLAYPVVYLIYILLRGETSGFYPYPFVDVSKLGLQRVLVNSFFLLVGFVVLSSIFVKLNSTLNQRMAK